MGNIHADCKRWPVASARRTLFKKKSLFSRRPLSQHRFFSCCACFGVRRLPCGTHRTHESLLLPLQTSSAQRMRVDESLSWHAWPRSHKEWESSWHGRDERRPFTTAVHGPAVGARRRAAWTGVLLRRSHPGMSRNRLILTNQDEDFLVKKLDSIWRAEGRRRVPDQRSGRLISGTQSLRRRLSSQNRWSFSRAGSSKEPSAGFCWGEPGERRDHQSQLEPLAKPRKHNLLVLR